MAYRLSSLDLQRCHSSYKQGLLADLPDFRADWAKASADDKADIFLRERELLNKSYQHLGLIGQLFFEAFVKTGCQEIMVLDDKQTPSFQGHHFSNGHQNKTLFGGWCFENREKFQDSFNHERVHAIQDSISAISHAIPYNGNSFAVVSPVAGVSSGAHRRIVLTPRDYMLLEELKERGAYTIQNTLASLRSPSFDPQKQLGQNLRNHAARVLEIWDVAGIEPLTSHLHFYRKKALDNYQFMMLNKNETPHDRDVIYVSFEAADIVALGNICGLTIFGDKKDDMSCWRSSPLNQEEQSHVDKLTRILGADKSVPFRIALQAIGFTPLEFLAMSRGPRVTKSVIAPVMPSMPAANESTILTVPSVPVLA